MGLRFFGNEVTRKIEACMADNLDLAGFSTLNVLKKLIGRNQPTKKVGRTISKKTGNKIGGTKVGLKPSKPKKPPKRVTGFLQKSYFWEQDRKLLTGRLGTQLKYGLFLEIGTARMKKRPHLLNSFFINKAKIVKALSRPCPGGL